jgi:serpin B
MLYNGSYGETCLELRQIFDYDKYELSDETADKGIKGFIIELNIERLKFDTNYEFFIANQILIQKGFKVLANYENEMKSYFNADLKIVDFTKRELKNEINDWIKEETNNKIETVFDQPFNPLTQFVIISALYFKGL